MSNNKPIKQIAIVGTGVIGASWAAQYLAKGFDVVATDPGPNAEANLRKYVDEAWSDLTNIGLSQGASRDRLSFTADMKKALSRADLVQENAPERPDFKMKLYADMDEVAPFDSLLASSSSGITPSVIQSKCKHPERVVIGHGVDQIDADGVIVAGERIASKTVIWTAGVAPSPAGKWLAVETDRAGRVEVQPDLSVPGHPEILVVGDTASLLQDGRPLPGVAQVAMQGGRYAGRLIARRLSGKTAPPPFRYFDKGNMAVVGKGFAIMQSGKIHLSGFFAWLAWAGIHIQFLATANLRISVFIQWVWAFLTGERGSRLIVNYHAPVIDDKSAASTAIKNRDQIVTGVHH